MLRFSHFSSSLRMFVSHSCSPPTLYTARYPNTSVRLPAALMWDGRVEDGCWARSFIGRIVLLPALNGICIRALWTDHSAELDSTI